MEGGHVVLPIQPIATPIAPCLDAGAMQAAVREAQANGPDYTYAGFLRKSGGGRGAHPYLVSFTGRRALYIGRDGATHVEHFPD